MQGAERLAVNIGQLIKVPARPPPPGFTQKPGMQPLTRCVLSLRMRFETRGLGLVVQLRAASWLMFVAGKQCIQLHILCPRLSSHACELWQSVCHTCSCA